jgi:hypothetical protein
MLSTKFLRWYTGKARDAVSALLPAFEESVREGEWVPGLARKWKAALNKATVAKKVSEQFKEYLGPLSTGKREYTGEGWEICHLLYFGKFQSAKLILDDVAELLPLLKSLKPEVRIHVEKALDEATNFGEDFLEIAGHVEYLDSMRPKPVFTVIGLSPTVTKTLQECGLKLDPKTVRMPPIVWEVVEELDYKGRPVRRRRGRIEWPKGTVHYASRFAHGNSQCHACGHLIKNPFNWVPILMDDASAPHSLWIGRDCAQKIFGIKAKGDIELEGSPGGETK